ncbi:hypothetical protein PGAL8A_00000300 [Plasmodium gallinaceum]|uniref:Uncharacterized protein n=1 Tax=Plasmodium gallinaceum TaxID=5849 RepID=A0A1J1H3Q3_PLAGA|nr:hypothetical protein PGAL8A_00000300 [Plasmodium gallinaceum]CRG97976.1 hypothetical protein PGAL8A_00000300 [Plasmodium gallinaceum]
MSLKYASRTFRLDDNSDLYLVSRPDGSTYYYNAEYMKSYYLDKNEILIIGIFSAIWFFCIIFGIYVFINERARRQRILNNLMLEVMSIDSGYWEDNNEELEQEAVDISNE